MPRPDDVPRVTVVMTTFNRQGLLRRALEALAAQTYPAELIQVVVVDNGSTDGTLEYLTSDHVPLRPVVVRIDRNVSPAVSRNLGLSHATGEIVAFTDDDCRPVPTWLDALVGALRPKIGIVQGLTRPDPAQSVGPLSRSQWTMSETGLYETCNIAYRRSALELEGSEPFSMRMPDAVRRLVGSRLAVLAFGEDTELAWRVKRRGVGTVFEPEAVVHHHVHPGDLAYVLRRSVLAAGFPALLRACPELADTLLWHRVFLGRRHALGWLAALGVAGAVGHPVTLVAVVPYLVEVLQPQRPGRRQRLRTGSVRMLRDVIEGLALAYGSIRTGRLVL